MKQEAYLDFKWVDPLLLTPEEISVAIIQATPYPATQLQLRVVIAKAQLAKIRNSPELREEIARKYHSAKVILKDDKYEVYLHPVDYDALTEEQKEWYRKQADQIQALFEGEKQ